MSGRKGMEVSIAVAEAVKLANADVIAAYPITPQTHIVEHLSELVADGELKAAFVPVESEHSALSAAMGAAAVGARAYTATASQGLALMHEIMFITSSIRLPLVMTVVNRALSAPINIWNDLSDIMAERDCGWIQLFAINGQEAVDLTLQAFKIAEDPRVLLPVAVNLDGFILSHVIEPVDMPEQEMVDRFLPVFKPTLRLDPDNPVTIGAFGSPDVFIEVKKQIEEALIGSQKVVAEVWKDFEKQFGRTYKPVESYKTKGAETLLVTMGSISETAMTAVDVMREKGQKVGLIHIRLWRPFPFKEFFQAIREAKVLAVVDRALSPGGPGGPVGLEIKSALFDKKEHPYVAEFVAGLGGRDLTVEVFSEMSAKAEKYAKSGKEMRYEMIGVREK
ncbi:MAG: transketolase C-terminal domain-containing protein [Thermodesulfobacteriota bacterium]